MGPHLPGGPNVGWRLSRGAYIVELTCAWCICDRPAAFTSGMLGNLSQIGRRTMPQVRFSGFPKTKNILEGLTNQKKRRCRRSGSSKTAAGRTDASTRRETKTRRELMKPPT